MHLAANNIYLTSTTDKFVRINVKIAKLFFIYNGIISNQILKYINKIYSNTFILAFKFYRIPKIHKKP